MTQEQGRVSVGAAVTGISDLKALNEAYRQWASSVRKSLGDINSATSAYNEMQGALRELQRTNKAQSAGATELRSKMRVAKDAIAEFADETKRAAEAQKAQAKAGGTEQVDAIIDANKRLVEALKQRYTTLEQVIQRQAQLSAEIRQLQNSENSNTDAVRRAIQVRREEAIALEQVGSGLRQQAQAANQSAQAQDRYAAASGRAVKQILLWLTTSASIYYLYRRIINILQETARELYGDTTQVKQLSDAFDRLKKAALVTILPPTEALDTFARLANILDSVSGKLLQIGSLYQGARAAGAQFARDAGQVSGFGFMGEQAATGFFALGAEMLGLTKGTDYLGTATDRANQVYQEFNKTIAASAEIDKDAASAISQLADRAMDFSDAQSEAAGDATDAWNDYQRKVTDINKKTAGGGGKGTDLAKQLAKINQNALKQQAKAFADYQRQLADIQRQAQMQEWQMAQQHALDMKFMAQRFRLDQIQSERIYQYSRQQLIAEGDVLAIEDLDARYKIERKAAKENYELQRKQAEAQYALQAEMLRKATEEQIRALKEALAEQLKEQEEARKEQEQEAKETAAQGGGGGGGANIADQMKEAHEEYMRQLTEEQQAADERTKENARQLAQYALDNNLTVDQVVAIWQKLTGDESPGLKFQTRQAYDAIVKMTQELGTLLANPMNLAGIKAGQQFGKGLTQQLQQDRSNLIRTAQEIAREMANAFNQIFIPGSGGRGTMPTAPGAPRPPNYPFFQHGGEMIVSQPTMIGVGEHGVTERVVVQPLSPIGGNIGVSWQGGPIQVNGSGFSGADAGAMTGVFNQMLRSFALEFVRQRSQIRGQRGK